MFGGLIDCKRVEADTVEALAMARRQRFADVRLLIERLKGLFNAFTDPLRHDHARAWRVVRPSIAHLRLLVFVRVHAG